MGIKLINESDLKSVANAIREKGGTSASLSFPGSFVDAIKAFPEATALDNLSVTSNGTYTPSSGHAFGEVSVNVAGAEDSIIDRTISGEYINNRVTKIGNNAFFWCDELIKATFPICSHIGSSTFQYCSHMSAISAPICQYIGIAAFRYCQELSTAEFPACSLIENYAFADCSSLAMASFNTCKDIYAYAFQNCKKLTTVSFPSCTTISVYAFADCHSLAIASFPACSNISDYAFRRCYKLLSVYLLNSSVAKLSNSNAFSSTPIAGHTTSTGGVVGSIFVRASLLTAFQSATNWAYFSSRMVGLTDEEIAALEE